MGARQYTIFLTLFLCWLLQEILEKKFGMEPTIIEIESVNTILNRSKTEIQAQESKSKSKSKSQTKSKRMIYRLSRAIDSSGKFRMEQRGSIYFVKTIWCMCIFIGVLFGEIVNPNWFYKHYILFDKSTIESNEYKHLVISLIGFYSYEMIAAKYYRVNYSVALHHWLTAGVCVYLLQGYYVPNFTFYGLVVVSTGSPEMFALGYRAIYAKKSLKNAKKARKYLYFAYWWFIGVCLVNLIGQLYLIIAQYFFVKRINEWEAVFFSLVMCGWIYDDIKTIKTLKCYARQEYEQAYPICMIQKENQTIARRLLSQDDHDDGDIHVDGNNNNGENGLNQNNPNQTLNVQHSIEIQME